MISPIDSSNLAYIPASRPAGVGAVSEEKSLNSQPAQAINFNQSISNSPSSKSSNSLSEDSDDKASKNHEDEAAKQQEQVRQVVDQLKARDREVRAHEMAHLSAAGSYAMGGMNLSYQRGPDGQQYAIGGSVQIDTSAIAGDPEATIQKGRVVQQAALAPAEPSSQDRKVASAAAQMISNAQADLMKAEREEQAVEKSDAGRGAEEEGGGSSTGVRGESSEEFEYSGISSNTNSNTSSALHTPENTARMQFDLRMQVAAG